VPPARPPRGDTSALTNDDDPLSQIPSF
jgi:hypothetical protein